jgi:Uri superfamily endonuclease
MKSKTCRNFWHTDYLAASHNYLVVVVAAPECYARRKPELREPR